MSARHEGNTLLEALKLMVIAIVRVCGLVVAWILRGLGSLILYLSNMIFKFAEK